MRVDAHVHYTPPALAARLPEVVQEEPYWGLLLAPGGTGSALQDWVEPERMLADMAAAGLDRAVILGSYWRHEDWCEAQNSQIMSLVHCWPDRLSGFCTVQPKAGARALDELKRCLDGGLCGVGEMGAYGQGWDLEDRDFLRLVEACIDYDIPLNLHVSEEIGHFYAGKSTTPLRSYYRLAERYPELRLILAHWGGGLFFYEIMPEVRKVLRNVVYDTAASPLLFPTAHVFPMALGALEPHKILYGSDYPLRICPAKQSGADFRPFLAEIAELGLSSGTLEAVLGGNTEILLGLSPGVGVKALPGMAETAAEHGAPGARPDRAPRRSALITEIDPATAQAVHELMAVRAVAEAWPATRPVFEYYGIAWRDTPVPYWEPIIQAAAALGIGPALQQQLLDDLNAAIGK
jgi:predicted TIM-barrel fold metal-dependent hydrolase